MHTHTAIYHISTYLHIYYIHIYIYIYIYIPPGFSPSHDFYKIGVPPQCHVYSLDKNGNFFFQAFHGCLNPSVVLCPKRSWIFGRLLRLLSSRLFE